MHTASQLTVWCLWPVADCSQESGVPFKCLWVSYMRGLLLMLCKLTYAVFLSLHYLSWPCTSMLLLECSAAHTFSRNCGEAPMSADLEPNVCRNREALEMLANSFLGVVVLLWQAVLVTLATQWSECTCLFFPLLHGNFSKLRCYVDSGTSALQPMWTVLWQPQFFQVSPPSPLPQHVGGQNSSASFCWTVHFVSNYGSHAITTAVMCFGRGVSMQNAALHKCCVLLPHHVCSYLLAVDFTNICTHICKSSFVQEGLRCAQCLGTLSSWSAYRDYRHSDNHSWYPSTCMREGLQITWYSLSYMS